MHAEIVVTGSELLLGEIVDTNSTMLARMVRDIGLNLYYKTTVGDNRERMAAVLSQALERSDIVITSGGLGPTVDDVTREAVSDATGRPLIFHQHLLDQIAARFARFGRPMAENNRRQAYVPEGAIIVENTEGTAPAFIVEDARGSVISLPGVPRELEHLMKTHVLPYLKRRIGQEAVIRPKVLRTCTIGESHIDTLIADLMTGSNPTVGLAAHSGYVDIRITAKAPTLEEADRLIAPVEAELRKRLGDVVYGEGSESLQSVVARLLVERGMTLCVVDSVTRGEIAERLRGAGHPEVLVGDQNYPDAVSAAAGLHLETFGLSDRPRGIVERAAARAREDAGASLGLAVLSMLSQAGGSPTAYLSLSDGHGIVSRAFRFGGEDDLTRSWITIRGLDMVRRYLLGILAGWESGTP